MVSEKEKFYNWLNTTVKEKDIPTIKRSCELVDDYCKKNKKLGFSLFETTKKENIQSALYLIQKDVFFRVKNGRLFNKINHSVDIYCNYISSIDFENEASEHHMNSKISLGKNEYVIDYSEKISFAYTRPCRFIYCGKTYDDFSNWTQMYTQVLTVLHASFPERIVSILGQSITKKGRIDLSDQSGYLSMTVPRQFFSGLYVETNLSATDIVEKIQCLLDICGIAYSDMSIIYEKKETALERMVTLPIEVTSTLTNKELFYKYLIEVASVSINTGLSYSSQINGCEAYGKTHSVGTGKLYSACTVDEAITNARLLMEDVTFLDYSRNSHNAPMAALRKYYEYLTGTTPSQKNTSSDVSQSKSTEDYSGIDFSRYEEVLSKNYRKGFRLNDKLSLKRLRMQWQRAYEEELDFDDETVFKHIMHITIRHGDMVYLPEIMMDNEIKERMLLYIEECFREGKKAIYYEALYREFEEDFSSCRINNVEMLKTYLTYINDGSMYLQRSYIAADKKVEIDTTDEVRSFLISQGVPVLSDDIVAALSHITEDKILWAISGNNSYEFVRNQKGEYFHADIIEFTQYEMDEITKLISLAIADKEYMGGKELTDTIEKKMPSIKERYPFLTWLGLRDVLAYKLRDSFSFKGKIISAYGKALSMTDVFADFARKHEHFTLEELNILKSDLDTQIYFDSIYANSLRINKDEFVSLEQASFDVEATDNAIERFCHSEYVTLKEISHFGAFPYAYFPWNHFLLQHYVANYSKKYKLIHTGFNAGNPVGAIVKKSSQLYSMDEIIIRALVENNIPLNRDDALQYLCDAGFLARRSYGSIDYLLDKANMQRTQKGE